MEARTECKDVTIAVVPVEQAGTNTGEDFFNFGLKEKQETKRRNRGVQWQGQAEEGVKRMWKEKQGGGKQLEDFYGSRRLLFLEKLLQEGPGRPFALEVPERSNF